MVAHKAVVLISVPHLRERDVAQMTQLRQMVAGGEIAELTPTFPCLTCPVQANMLSGCPPREHGIIANGFFWRERKVVEMWTSPSDCFDRPLIWHRLAVASPPRSTAVWFALHTKGADADLVCTPAPIHHADGTESVWCFTRPLELYGELKERFGDFPLHHYWGPLAGLPASEWIVNSAIYSAEKFRPEFFYIYLPLLDYAAQREGPDSSAAQLATQQLDQLFGKLAEEFTRIYNGKLVWLVAGEYVITPVGGACFPNRLLREEGLLRVQQTDEGEYIDWQRSRAFALVDHQVAHVFILDGEGNTRSQVEDLFRSQPEIERVLSQEDLPAWALDHPRSGELVLIAQPTSWFAYYWWLSEEDAPAFARTVDIHRKPGYDPVELCWDPVQRCVPLDPSLIHGSHGAPADDPMQRTVLLASEPAHLPDKPLRDIDVYSIVLSLLGLKPA
jgi:predicted AlkP superfamily pyrophosphatase or phosphodiesterase